MEEPVELIPSADRLIHSLRDLGYDFSQAVADLVDNSIEAGATLVAIDAEFDGDDSWVRISDNGGGMKPEDLREALRYGSQRKYTEQDLGKFGLGLKTASLSQCRRLSVASRWSSDRANITGYCWDLDHIAKTKRWEILPLEKSDLSALVRDPLRDHQGTVVIWQRLDRILGFDKPYGEFARKRLSQMCRDLELHLRMVFHRFISGESKRRKLRIYLNGNELASWDPYCRHEKSTKKLSTITLDIQLDGEKKVQGQVLIEPFILPHQNDFSSPESFRSGSGPAAWNQQQGFYFYRADRLIQAGGWSRLKAVDEHTKLARIAVSFSPRLDDAFKINVAKMSVQLPAAIRDQVKVATGPAVKIAQDVYRNRDGGATGGISSGGQGASPWRDGKGPKVWSEKMTFDEWASKVLRAASRNEKSVVESVIHRVREAK